MHIQEKRNLALEGLNRISTINGENCVVLTIETAQMIADLLKNTEHCSSNLDATSELPRITTLSKEEIQTRRDEVRTMVAKEAPIEEIPLYMGKRVHGEAVTFFKTHYAPYIARGQEVIFASELMKIDHSLLLALRNECRTSACLIPIGTVSDRTDALMQERFLDGKHSLRTARAAASVRAFREKQKEK